MKLHIIGVCGTFMGGVARLARELGHSVSGSDANTYPPMSTQLESLGIDLAEGYRAENIPEDADMIVVGNTISRGNPELEHVLDRGLPYFSGAQWLRENVLRGRWVLAVAGTHGKTTTSSILAWLLQDNDLAPGYLIGGVPENFGESARLGETSFFVIEADEYDTAFCDKRSKFVHYEPRTLILNNLEFDHADIFADLRAIQTQFHHLMKIVPSSGQVIFNRESTAISEVLEMGLWSEPMSFGADADWQAQALAKDASRFEIRYKNTTAQVSWSLIGEHNMYNALAAVAAAHHVGIPIANACESLSTFRSVKRRLELVFENTQVRVFDDFAHHPTAIRGTLDALRQQVGDNPILAILEPRSNTMKRGVHKHLLADALQSANNVMIFADDQVSWDINELASDTISTYSSIEKIVQAVLAQLETLTRETRSDANSVTVQLNVLIMSNGGFGGLHKRLTSRLENSIN
jgi:UDP-N-acetylmuramate: L-alanyl-gamma-D-glutamyl-meso-diaminopimelate ligase